MAQIINDDTGEIANIPDNSSIKEACSKIGVSFGCEAGNCGTCMIKVVEGMKNLGDLNEPEKNMGLSGEYRLACQCKIKNGKIRFKY